MRVNLIIGAVFVLWSYCSNLSYRMTFGRPLQWFAWPCGCWASILQKRLKGWER